MSKILKTKSKGLQGISIVVPKLTPVEEERFESILPADPQDKKTSKRQEVSIEKVIEEARQKGYNEGFEKGFSKGLEEGKKEGYKEGFEKGYQEGSVKAEREKEALVQRLEEEYKKKATALEREFSEKINRVERFLEACSSELKDLVLDLDKEVLKIAVKIAEKLVLKEIQTDPEVNLRIIREALNYIAEGSSVIIKVNPEEFEFLEKEVLKEVKGRYKVKFVKDPNVKKGGVFVESELGTIDATFEKRWEKLLSTIGYHENKGS